MPAACAAAANGSSPLARGALRRVSQSSLDRRIIPAGAGSTRPPARSASPGRDHPRWRGEHLVWTWREADLGGSSPLARGAPQLRRLPGHAVRIIPAGAGSTGRRASCSGVSRDHPRWRGEHHVSESGDVAAVGSSPLARGALPAGSGARPDGRIIPAGAGSTTCWIRCAAGWTDHPRWRGEHCQVRRENAAAPRIIPAGAGSTTGGRHERDLHEDHPRWRGEHTVNARYALNAAGSSPLARGARPPQEGRSSSRGIIPAGAGSTRSLRRTTGRTPDHPRWRGEHSRASRRSRRAWGSSPLARGALPRWSVIAPPLRIIPAGAGSTRRCPVHSRDRRDHPRWRGEHLSVFPRMAGDFGSSPLARGALED